MSILFSFPIRVYIEDTDAEGIVYHANHIKYMERCRTEWLRSLGIEFSQHNTDYNFVAHELSIKYHRPILMDDLIQVTAKIISCKSASFRLHQQIYRDEVLLASGEISIACVSSTLRPQRLPSDLHQIILTQLNG